MALLDAWGKAEGAHITALIGAEVPRTDDETPPPQDAHDPCMSTMSSATGALSVPVPAVLRHRHVPRSFYTAGLDEAARMVKSAQFGANVYCRW
jgi:hypothetical protein